MKQHKNSKGNYALIFCGSGFHKGKKFNAICPKCGFNAKVPFDSNFTLTNKVCNHTLFCPKCKIELQNLGTKTLIPKKGSRKFKKFMKK